MNKSWKIGALLGIAGMLCVVIFMSLNRESDPKTNDNENSVVKDEGKRPRRNVSKKKVKKRRDPAKQASDSKDKPIFALDDDDEAKLNAEQRKMIEAIRAALEDEDRARVLKLVQALQASKEWPDGIPKSIKMAAIDALGWFGSSCLPEIAGFLGDGDPEVVQSAIDKFEEALADVDLSDRERAKILLEAAKVIDDEDTMDSMLFELNNMRHSVAIATMKQLMETGTPATKAVLQENIDLYTGEEDLTTPEQLDEWLRENPDDEDDEEFYNPPKD